MSRLAPGLDWSVRLSYLRRKEASLKSCELVRIAGSREELISPGRSRARCEAPGPAGQPRRPPGPTDPLTMRTCALYGRSRAPRGAVSTSGRDDGLRPPRPRPPSPREPPQTAGSRHPDRLYCPWHTRAPFQLAIGPASGIISPAIIGHLPRRRHARVCVGVRLG